MSLFFICKGSNAYILLICYIDDVYRANCYDMRRNYLILWISSPHAFLKKTWYFDLGYTYYSALRYGLFRM